MRIIRLLFVLIFLILPLLSMDKESSSNDYSEQMRIITHSVDDHSQCDSCYDVGSGVCGTVCFCAPCDYYFGDVNQDSCCDVCYYQCGFFSGKLNQESKCMDWSERCACLFSVCFPLNLGAYLLATPENAAWYFSTGKIVSFVSVGMILLASIPCVCQKILRVGYRCASRLHAKKAQKYTLGYREGKGLES